MEKQRNKIKKIEGVTMVALVVSIIILLILSGVVITVAVGDNGIITRAKKATELYKQVEKNECVQLNNLYTQLASLGDGSGSVNVEQLNEIINEAIDNKFLSKYPVGSIYISQDEKNPSEFIGGEWEQIKDTFLLSAGDIYEAGSTGGEASHKLTIQEIPSHSHSYSKYIFHGGIPTNYTDAYLTGMGRAFSIATASTTAIGNNVAHNNMPPYLTVYMYKRIN